MIADSDENLEAEGMVLQQMMSRNVDGLIIAPCSYQWDHIQHLYEHGLPIVCIDRYFEGLEIPFVSTDNYNGAYNATKHLIENGHSIITCIQGVQHSTPNKLRVKGFKNAMEESGLQDCIVTGDDFSIQNGYLETPLSCIAQPIGDISKIAVKLLLSQINKEENKNKQVLLKPQMQLKKSVKRIV